jgi:hypothetical protein
LLEHEKNYNLISMSAFNESSILVMKRLPEMSALEKVLKSLKHHARVEIIDRVSEKGIEFPLYGIVIGSQDRTAPTLALSGGVHGLERIGSEVVISYLNTISQSLEWDETLNERLKVSRLVFMPIVNPVGMFLTRRSNGNHVDLMRNSPVVAEQDPPFLLGGQRISKVLPWFTGSVTRADEMEVEARALASFYKREVLGARISMSIDVHSGFGTIDQLWFPYAKSRRPPPHIAEIHALKNLFDRTYSNHFYKIEPQAYTTHGDLWDYMYDHSLGAPEGNLYLPWTLELGSWLWIRKNPRQLFSALGPFNPLKPHRLQRILRRHLTLFDFLHRAIISPGAWTHLDDHARKQLTHKAMDLWYAA